MKRIDFDIEANAVTDQASVALATRRLRCWKVANPGLQVTYTLHADPSVPNAAPGGMPAGQVALLKDAITKGVKVTEVNLMTMDWGSWWVSQRHAGNLLDSGSPGRQLAITGPVRSRPGTGVGDGRDHGPPRPQCV